ncbi:MAG: hypothetical protein ACREYB_12825 [Casimicrobiaceae bacterium]
MSVRRHRAVHMQTDSYDVAAVGGGAAGLSAALVLGVAWLVAQGQWVVPIPGTKTTKYLLDNTADLDTLPAPEGARL